MTERIILVDEFDRPIGSAEKMEAHRTPKLHRAFSVFIHHNGYMLVQQRAMGKYHSGGLWANACCSHPREDESTELAVVRRLEQEIGVRGIKPVELFSFVYEHKFNDCLYEHEYDHVFAADYSGALSANEDEIMETKWIEFGELSSRLRKTPEEFAVWFLIAAPRVLAIKR
ncbi:MAG: isopentenyl-diphosphate Delta-isomerase [Synergistaceae bacterium]|jgi:isopentenyl-diphosphate delta-isomerase|nr:isopentenyl-diphosphate Delta-isomerase [Synergistaceae bacterium]